MPKLSKSLVPFTPILVPALLLGSACGGESTGPHYETGCKTNTVTITVSSGVVPQFNWSPNCGVWSLQVTELAAPNQRMWGTGTMLANELLPPVTYGVHPANASGSLDPVAYPLQPGVTYEVTLNVISDALKFRTAGQKSFTP